MQRKLKIPGNIRYILGVIAVLLLLNFILRLAFLFNNFSQAQVIEWGDLLQAFAVGLRFDLATLLIFNGLIFLLLLVPHPLNFRPRTYKIVNVLIVLLNFPVLLMNGIDVVYFGFSEKRMTHELYAMTADDFLHWPLADALIRYWWMILLLAVMVYGLLRLLKILSRFADNAFDESNLTPRWKYWGLVVLGAGLIFTGIRGGLQTIPLRPSHAFISPNLFAGNLGLNSAYTVVASATMDTQNKVEFIPEPEATRHVREMLRNPFDVEFAPEDYPLLRRAEFDGPERDYNVVYIVMESFTAANAGVLNGLPPAESITPEFDALAAEGVLFTQFYATANRSVEALPGLLNSIPDIYSRPLIGSDKETINQWGLGNMLNARGYETSFYHGGRNGSMGFDNYTKISGLEHYFGKNEYPFPDRDYDEHWGIYDGPFMQWWAEELNQTARPFFSVFFSVSNHHPFALPPDAADIAQSNLTPFQKTTRYADRALGDFFRAAKQSDWYAHTVFVITADHCFFESSDPGRTILGLSHIPLLIIAPGLQPRVDRGIGSHVHVLPTLIELLRLDTWHASSAISLLNPVRKSFAVTRQASAVTIIRNELALGTDFEKPKLHLIREGEGWKQVPGVKGLSPALVRTLEYDLRCSYQVFKNARIENRLIGNEYLLVP